MQRENNARSITSQRSSRPTYDRAKEHASDALLLLNRLRRANVENKFLSTAELQAERIYGLRPVNRVGDLIRGKYGPHYDIERITCGHGTFRWRLHEPARPGYPKPKNQTVLPLDEDRKPVTSLKTWEQVVKERDERLRQSAPPFELVP